MGSSPLKGRPYGAAEEAAEKFGVEAKAETPAAKAGLQVKHLRHG